MKGVKKIGFSGQKGKKNHKGTQEPARTSRDRIVPDKKNPGTGREESFEGENRSRLEKGKTCAETQPKKKIARGGKKGKGGSTKGGEHEAGEQETLNIKKRAKNLDLGSNPQVLWV